MIFWSLSSRCLPGLTLEWHLFIWLSLLWCCPHSGGSSVDSMLHLNACCSCSSLPLSHCGGTGTLLSCFASCVLCSDPFVIGPMDEDFVGGSGRQYYTFIIAAIIFNPQRCGKVHNFDRTRAEERSVLFLFGLSLLMLLLWHYLFVCRKHPRWRDFHVVVGCCWCRLEVSVGGIASMIRILIE